MKDSIHKYFQVGTIQWMSYPNSDPMDSLKAICRDDFFDAIELKGYGEKNAEAKALLDQSHLKVCYGAQPRLLGPKLNPNAINEEDRKKAEATLMEAIDEAEYLGAKGIAFLAGKWEEATKDQAYAQLLKTTRNLCDYAATKGMNVELEVFDFDMDKAALIGPAPYAAKFAADMRTSHSNFGLLVDLSHFPTTYETSQFVIRTLRPYITHFHFGNAATVMAICIPAWAIPRAPMIPPSCWIICACSSRRASSMLRNPMSCPWRSPCVPARTSRSFWRIPSGC